jgi:hypothetical protein
MNGPNLFYFGRSPVLLPTDVVGPHGVLHAIHVLIFILVDLFSLLSY